LLPTNFADRLIADGPDAVIYADAAGHIRFWNAAATRIFGFTAEEALGQRLDLIIPERLRVRHWEGYDRVMAGAVSRYGEGGAGGAGRAQGRTTTLDRIHHSAAARRCRQPHRHRRLP